MNFTKASINIENEKARFVASTGNEDKHGDIVNPDGWQLDDFKNNPVVLFAHDSRKLPVGRVTKIDVIKKRLIADVEFLPKGLDEFADKVRVMVEKKFLNMVSVGFRALELEPRFNAQGHFIGHKILKQSLSELSIVPVGANPEALQLAKSLNFTNDEINALIIKPDQSTVKSLKHRMNKIRAGIN